jgi:hypothetical protein
MEHFGGKFTKETAGELLLESCAELAESVVTAAWDFGDTAVEDDEESGPVDEGFRLEMAEASDDEDIRERRSEIPEDYEEEEDNEYDKVFTDHSQMEIVAICRISPSR